MKNLTPGMKSSEFVLTVLSLVGVLVLILVAASPEETNQFVDFAKWAVGAYAASRGLAKFGSRDGVTSAPGEGRV